MTEQFKSPEIAINAKIHFVNLIAIRDKPTLATNIIFDIKLISNIQIDSEILFFLNHFHRIESRRSHSTKTITKIIAYIQHKRNKNKRLLPASKGNNMKFFNVDPGDNEKTCGSRVTPEPSCHVKGANSKAPISERGADSLAGAQPPGRLDKLD